MGKLNDKMTKLADAIREKAFIVHIPGVIDNFLSIDRMITIIKDELYSFADVGSLDAELSDVTIGKKFISYTGKVSTGTMPDTAAVLDGNTVTIPAGRIREEQTLTVAPGSVSIDGNKVTVVEGYVTNTTLTVAPGSVSIDGDTVNVSAGYVEDAALTVPAGSVVVDESINKVIVSEGYVQADEIDLPSAASFYLCTKVFGPKKVSGFIVSGAGTAAVNGKYIPTDLKTEADTPIYKHETAEYYYFDMWDEQGICTSPTQYPSEGLYYNMWGEGWTTNSGAEPAPTVTAGNFIINANVPKTWNGYKTVQTSTGAFTLDETPTTGLPYSRLTPAVGRVYSQDALVKASYFRLNRPGELLMIPLVSNEWKADTGQELTIVDDARLDCESFRFGNLKSDVNAPLSYSGGTLTISTWVKSYSSAVLFSLRNASIEINFEYFSNKVVAECGDRVGEVYAPEGMELGGDLKGRWTHFTVVLLPDKMKLYVNGRYWGESELGASVQNQVYTSAHVHTTNRLITQAEHWVKDFRVYSRELSSAEISAICEENNPVK